MGTEFQLGNTKKIWRWVQVMVAQGLPDGSVVKTLSANAGDSGHVGSIPRSGRSPGGGKGNPLQYSCMANPSDRGA